MSYTKEEAKVKIVELVDSFIKEGRNISNYAEEEIKQKLIQPLFEYLGWNFQVMGENSEVHYEGSLFDSKTKTLKRVDYVFGNKHFFLEAKAVIKNLLDKEALLYQANAYAYNHSKFCILTDFDKFALIRPIKPNKKKVSLCIVDDFILSYTDYKEKADLLFDTFSKEAVYGGSLDRLLEKEQRSRKYLTIDDDFLADLEDWRKEVAFDIYSNNRRFIDANNELLTECTQRFLDRIIFTRILEDKNIEENILEKYIDKKNAYEGLLLEFKRLSRIYNGLVFNSHPIDNVSISDKTISTILSNLYDTSKSVCVYQFDKIPIEILGSIYERFLGNIIEIHPEQKNPVKVKEKPEVNKAGGVYYTPAFIVDYIVENTVGKLFKDKTPKQVENYKIADIACGSGSFLVRTYSYLLQWYHDYYNKHTEQIRHECVEAILTNYQPDGNVIKTKLWKLTREKRRDILLHHIYGVDIDPSAVETTQMSLYLKMLEDCPDIQKTLELKEIILPDLRNNIKCGNSLLEIENKYVIRPFNWQVAFPEIIKLKNSFEGYGSLEDNYGFDCIIGNPPYRKGSETELDVINKDWLELRKVIKSSGSFNTVEGRWDLFIPFIERAMSLLKNGGFHGYIVEHSIELTPYADKIRELLYNKNSLYELHFFPKLKLFKNAQVETTVYLCQKTQNKSRTVTKRCLHKDNSFTTCTSLPCSKEFNSKQVFNYNSNPKVTFNNTIPLGTVFCVCGGAQLQSHEGKFRKEFTKDDLLSDKKEGYFTEKYLEGDEIKDYSARKPRYVAFYKYIRKIKRPRFPELFKSPKLLLGCSSGGIIDLDSIIVNHSVLILKRWDEIQGVYNHSLSKYEKYFNAFGVSRIEAEKTSNNYSYYSVLAILLSTVGKDILKATSKSSRTVTEDTLKEFPLAKLDNKNKDIFSKLEELAIKNLEYHRELTEKKTETQHLSIGDKLSGNNREIESLVSTLYGIQK